MHHRPNHSATGKGTKSRLSFRNLGRSRTGIQIDSIIHGILEALLAAKVLLCSLDRDVSKEKLNLFEFAAGLNSIQKSAPLEFPGPGTWLRIAEAQPFFRMICL